MGNGKGEAWARGEQHSSIVLSLGPCRKSEPLKKTRAGSFPGRVIVIR